MALADFATYKTLLASPAEIKQFSKQTIATQNGRLNSYWTLGNVAAGTAPSTAVAPTSATAGAMGQTDGGSGALHVLGVRLSAQSAGVFLLCDRLSHQGGLDATSVITLTTNLPTAALTRYTGGVGVWACLEIYTAIGATATTATAIYTNQDGTATQTTQPTVFGGTGYNAAGRIIPLGLASGDTGVQAVTSVLLAGSTGTAGNFGVTLLRPLLAIPAFVPRSLHDFDVLLALSGQFNEIVDGACLTWLCFAGSDGATGNIEGTLRFSEV